MALNLHTHLDEQLAGPQDEPCVRVANPGRKLSEGSGIARVRVRAKQHLARLAVALLRRPATHHIPPRQAVAGQAVALLYRPATHHGRCRATRGLGAQAGQSMEQAQGLGQGKVPTAKYRLVWGMWFRRSGVCGSAAQGLG